MSEQLHLTHRQFDMIVTEMADWIRTESLNVVSFTMDYLGFKDLNSNFQNANWGEIAVDQAMERVALSLLSYKYQVLIRQKQPVLPFDQFVQTELDDCMSLLLSKGSDYSGQGNRMYDIYMGSMYGFLEPVSYLRTLAVKHWVSCGKIVDKAVHWERSYIDSKFNDAINYCFLVKATVLGYQINNLARLKPLEKYLNA